METGKNCVVFILNKKRKEFSDKSCNNSAELVQNGLRFHPLETASVRSSARRCK